MHPDNDALISRLATKLPLTSDPTQYTYPLYQITSSTPGRTVKLSGYFSTYTSDTARVGHGFAATIAGVPVPPNAVPSTGSDHSLIFWDPITGDEWGFWGWNEDAGGRLTARNGYHYNTRWSGRFFDANAGRGAGIPYFAGLVRPWEVKAGKIEHALALAYNAPSPESSSTRPARATDRASWVSTCPREAASSSTLRSPPPTSSGWA